MKEPGRPETYGLDAAKPSPVVSGLRVLLLSMLGGLLLYAALEVVFAFDVVAATLAGVACCFTAGAWIVYGVHRLPAPAGLLAFLRHAAAWPSHWSRRGP